MTLHPKISGKKAVFFDVNETLIRQGMHFEQAFHNVWDEFKARWLGPEGGSEDDLWERYQILWQQHKKTRSTRMSFDQLQQRCLLDALNELNVPVHHGFPGDFFQSVRKRRLAAKSVGPDVERTLNQLTADYKLAIISNSPQSEVKHLLNRFNLLSLFGEDRIFTAHKLTEKKPNVPLFKMALNRMGLTSRQAVMVGNSWKHDICGAAKAGLDAIWLQPLTEGTEKKISQQKLGKRNIYRIQQIDQLLELFH